MKKLNILEFSHQRELGGTDKHSQLMMTYCDKDKFNMFAASYFGGPRAQWITDNNIPNFISNQVKDMIDWIKSQNIDVVHFYRGGGAEPIDIHVFKEAGIPVLIEQNCFAKLDDSADRAKIDIHVVNSSTSEDIYKARAGEHYDANKVRMIYVPIENDKFNKVKIDYQSQIFGRYSRADANKWHPVNIRCLPHIHHHLPEAKFYVIGLPDTYRDAIKTLNLTDMVVEFPATSDDGLLDFMSKISVFTHAATIGESFGNVIAESMAAGLPIVTHTGGDGAQAELVSNDYNGYVLNDIEDERKYANKIIRLLKNPNLKEEMGQAGRQRSRQCFDAKRVVKEFEDLYIEQYKLKFGE